jgi:hypothetical protein
MEAPGLHEKVQNKTTILIQICISWYFVYLA